MSRTIQRLARLLHARDGVSTIEFAIVAPAIAILLVGITDFGMGLWEEMQVADAAQAGAAYAALNGWNSTSTGIETAVTSATSLSGLQASPAPSMMSCACPNSNSSALASATCGGSCPDGSTAGHYWIVNAKASYSTILPYPGITSPMNLTSKAYARLYP